LIFSSDSSCSGPVPGAGTAGAGFDGFTFGRFSVARGVFLFVLGGTGDGVIMAMGGVSDVFDSAVVIAIDGEFEQLDVK
jgi:hypothetical protein